MRSIAIATLAMATVVALVGFAGAANASATLDLIWIDVTDSTCTDADRRDCPQIGPEISSVFTSDNITLAVIVTAGPKGYYGGMMSVDYSDALPTLRVVDFRRLLTTFPKYYLPIDISNNAINDTGTRIETMLTTASPWDGIGLPASQTAYIGTVTFHKDVLVNGTFEISVDTLGPGDGLGNLEYDEISATTTFNSAFLISVATDPASVATDPASVATDPAWCSDSQGNSLQIEVNALRAGGKTVSTGANQTVDVTAKARILKGTAASGTTIDTTLTIEAVDGATVIGTNATAFEAVRLEVGKGGQGAKLAVDVPQCDSGFIGFVASFVGTDEDGDDCLMSRTLYKECR